MVIKLNSFRREACNLGFPLFPSGAFTKGNVDIATYWPPFPAGRGGVADNFNETLSKYPNGAC
jgi:hypothetical protein